MDDAWTPEFSRCSRGLSIGKGSLGTVEEQRGKLFSSEKGKDKNRTWKKIYEKEWRQQNHGHENERVILNQSGIIGDGL